MRKQRSLSTKTLSVYLPTTKQMYSAGFLPYSFQCPSIVNPKLKQTNLHDIMTAQMPNNHGLKKKIVKVEKLQNKINFEIYVLSVSDLEKRKMPTTATTHLRSFCWVVFSHIYVKQFYCSFWSKAICMYSFSIKLIYRKFSKLCLPATFIKWFCFDMLAFFGGKSPKANKHIFLNHTANIYRQLPTYKMKIICFDIWLRSFEFLAASACIMVQQK